MNKNPLETIVKNDQEFFNHVMKSRDLAFSEGALSPKIKILMALALDASIGTEDGVRALATQAIEAGATKEEIMETVRVAGFVVGVHSVFTAANGLDGLI